MATNAHICLVADDDCLERFGSAVRQLCVGLIDEAIRTTVVGPQSTDLGSLQFGPVRIEQYRPLSWWRRKRVLADLVARLASNPPTVIHAQSGGTVDLAVHLAEALDVPLAVTLTGTQELTEESEPLLRSAALIIAVSEPIRTQAIQRLRRSGEDIVRIPWGVRAEREPTCFIDEEKIPTIVAIGSLTEGCGLEHVIDAMDRLVRSGQQAVLFILGGGPLESRLFQQVNRLGLSERVTFVGPFQTWSSVLEGADIYLVPAAQGLLTIHPIAAMASGLVLAAAESGDHDCLHDGKTARVYDPPSPEMLAAVLAEIMSDRDESRRLAAMAQHYATENHRISTMVADTIQAYRRLALDSETIRLPSQTASRAGDT